MRDHIFAFAEEAVRVLTPPDPVIEIGARPASGQEHLTDLRTLFPGAKYIGCDIQEGPRVDRIEDVHRLSFEDESIGTVLAMDTLEHVRDPIRAVEEMHRVLRPDGVVLISSVMFFPIHAHPWDYWRFTPEGFAQLLAPFASSLVCGHGWADMPESVLGIGCKDPDVDLSRTRFTKTMEMVDAWGSGSRVDLGPIRLSTRQAWSLALGATRDAIRDRMSRSDNRP